MSDASPGPARSSKELGEHVLRIGLVVLLVVSTFRIVEPFVVPVMWSIIIAVTVFPVFTRIDSALGRRRALSATVTTLLTLAILIVPATFLGDTLVETAEHLAADGKAGGIRIPPPPDGVATLPLIGPKLEQYWNEASNDTSGLARSLSRYLEPVGKWLVSATAGVTFALFELLAAIVLAGVLMARAPELIAWARRVVLRLAPNEGASLVRLAGSTIRNVSRGVVGVALIQTLCAGVAFLLVGIPAAGLWTLLCFFFATIQVGVLPVTGPAAVYALLTMDLVIAIPFALWCGFVGIIDNILRPLLLHQGLSTPLWVVVVGSIGGIISAGLIGLFIGPVLLVLAYELGQSWLAQDPSTAGEQDTTPDEAGVDA